MQVLILKTNQIQEVKDAYAVNYLIPKGLAVVATDHVQKEMEAKLVQKKTENQEHKQKQQELVKKLSNQTITIKAKTNGEGQLYAAIGENQIKKLLKTKEHIEIISKEVIKKVGKYEVGVKVGGLKVNINIEVIGS